VAAGASRRIDRPGRLSLPSYDGGYGIAPASP